MKTTKKALQAQRISAENSVRVATTGLPASLVASISHPPRLEAVGRVVLSCT